MLLAREPIEISTVTDSIIFGGVEGDFSYLDNIETTHFQVGRNVRVLYVFKKLIL